MSTIKHRHKSKLIGMSVYQKSSSSDDMLLYIFPATFSDFHSSHATMEVTHVPRRPLLKIGHLKWNQSKFNVFKTN